MKTRKWKTFDSVIFFLFLLTQTCTCEKCPEYCHCSFVSRLRHAECASQRLVNIDLDLPKRVQSLDLSNNSISVLDDKGFQNAGLTNLIRIDMKYNSIMQIGREAFYGLHELRYVNLKGNHLHSLHAEIFHDNLNLINVVLADNPLQHLKNEALLNGPSIQSLDISGCRFGYFMKKTFENFESLKFLNLSRNQLILIDFSTIEILVRKNLEEIDISRNQIRCDKSFQSLHTKLEEKSVHLIGAPCKFSPNTPQHKFENLIMPDDSKTEMVDSNTTQFLEDKFTESWTEFHNKFISEMKNNKIMYHNNVTSNSSTTINVLNGCNYYNYNNIFNIPQVWIFAIGFQIGMITTMVLVFIIWIIYSKVKSKYHKNSSKPYELINSRL